MKYRSEIDGLRALAVIPVILFHAGYGFFSGGYVGVDVFFVISGYLITTIILSDMEAGKFSLIHFYERRARRILPALFLIMLASLIAAYLWLLPIFMKDFSQSLIATSAFYSNILFWRESGYWDAASELKPLLHTWSLAVEEQYYILFPLFLMTMWRFSTRWIFGSFMIIAVSSLLIAQWGAYNHPSASFFLLPTRAWELALGAGIAFYFLYRKQTVQTLLSYRFVDETLSLIGLLMIAYAVHVFDKTTPFPGVYALLPTVGTGLIILFSSDQTMVGRFLGTRFLVWIGLISYSAYLWHYPLFAFARHLNLTEPGAQQFAILTILTFLLAYLSWRFVERPFRKSGVFSRKTVFIFALAGSTFFISIGLFGHFTNGWPGRFDEALWGYFPVKSADPQCEVSEFKSESICELAKGQKKLTFLIGDSHSASIAHEMKTSFSRENIGLLSINKGACPPVRGVYRADRGGIENLHCYRYNENLYRYISESQNIEYIVLLARWTLSMEGSRFDNREGGVETSTQRPHLDLVVNGQPEFHPKYDHRSELAARYSASINALLNMGKKVILIYPVPEAGWHVPGYLLKYHLLNPDQPIDSAVGSTSHQVFVERNHRTYQALDSVGQHPNLYRVYPEKMLCNNDAGGRCIVQREGQSLYLDDDHLSDSGAKLIADEISRWVTSH